MTPLKKHKLNYNLLTSFFKIEVYIFILLFIFSSCSTTRKIKNDIASGNYDKAITESISKIKTIKNNTLAFFTSVMIQYETAIAKIKNLIKIILSEKDNTLL